VVVTKLDRLERKRVDVSLLLTPGQEAPQVPATGDVQARGNADRSLDRGRQTAVARVGGLGAVETMVTVATKRT
jgi:hypothetical protein